MVCFLGRSLETTTIPSKPIPTGFKVWTMAQRGYFLRWIWLRPGRKFRPVGWAIIARTWSLVELAASTSRVSAIALVVLVSVEHGFYLRSTFLNSISYLLSA
ncbi:Uncharacterized protein HZ326_26508 [Fusarium oxysporum f. sp. albedinis]|nr:Uncharacterized protein HZ326_26508 [Fusarium oxysporum f. sp. albedinis]